MNPVIDGLVILTVIDPTRPDQRFNNESYGGEPYYKRNAGQHKEVLEYYNGETYEEYLERFAEDKWILMI
jgi:hypothetical protein